MQIKKIVSIASLWFIPFLSSAQNSEQKFPEFNLKDGFGKTISTKELITPNKYTLFLVYGNWGSPCNKSVTKLNDLREEWKTNYDIEIKVIAADNSQKVGYNKETTTSWLKKNGEVSNSYYDFENYLQEKAGIKACPVIIISNAQQEIIYSRQGFIHEEDQISEITSFFKQKKLKKNYPNGAFEIKHDNGVTLMVGTLKNGNYDKLWKDYYTNGQLKSIGIYDTGIIVGEWKNYHNNGELKSIGMWENDNRKGEWKYYDNEGNLKEIGLYSGGNRTGIWKEYYDNKIWKIGNWENGLKSGEWKEYDENGNIKKIGSYSKGKEIGIWKTYSRGFLWLLANYETGEFTYYHDNGNVEKKGRYEKGNYIGEWKEYYENGNLKKAEFYNSNNELEGERKSFHENGKTYTTQLYSNGKLMEVIICKDENGNVLNKGTLVNGNGTLNVYYNNGTLNKVYTYKEGIMVVK